MAGLCPGHSRFSIRIYSVLPEINANENPLDRSLEHNFESLEVESSKLLRQVWVDNGSVGVDMASGVERLRTRDCESGAIHVVGKTKQKRHMNRTAA